MNKKILIIILIIIIILPIGIIIYPVIENNKYQNKLLDNIYENTSIKNVEYLNKDNNYYIIKNKDKVIVLDLNYEEIYSINTNELIDSNLDLTYIRNNLYYKERKKENNKLVYKYFDVKTNKEVYTTTLGGSNEWDRKNTKRKANSIT